MPTRLLPGSHLWLFVAVAAIAFLSFFTPDNTTLLGEALMDAGHAPLFGVIAIALLQFFRRPGSAPLRPYLPAWSITVFLGAATEASQFFGPRDADFWDLARNVLGATAFLLIAFSLARSSGPHPTLRRPRKVLLIAAAVFLLGAAFYPVAAISVAYLQRDASFPVLCDFEAGPMLKFTGVKDGELLVVPRPPACGQDRHAAKVTLQPAVYPGFGIREPYPDWIGYEVLAFDVYSELPTTFELEFRIHDEMHDRRYEDRFNRSFLIHPGCNSIRVPLSDVRYAPEGREMDMTRILGVVLFAVRPTEPLTFFLDSFRLE